MPSKKAASKSKRNYRKKTYKSSKRPTPTKGRGSNPDYQIINTIPMRIYKFKDTMQLNDVAGAAATLNGYGQVFTFSIKDIARYANLTSMFRQVRITKAKFRFRLETTELTDGAKLSTLYVKYNYDPDLVQGSLSEDYMLRQSNVCVKQFHHNTNKGAVFTYDVKPAIMRATRLYNSTDYVPSPAFNQWVDIDPSGTLIEPVHHGLQYWFTTVQEGQRFNIDMELEYECRDLV